jgi:hypothetical protein
MTFRAASLLQPANRSVVMADLLSDATPPTETRREGLGDRVCCGVLVAAVLAGVLALGLILSTVALPH